MKVDVIIPVYKPGAEFFVLLDRLLKQSLPVQKIHIVNTDKAEFEKRISTEDFLKKYPEKVCITHIAKEEFDHGKTRHEAVSRSDADILCFMTMDAVPAHTKMLERLTAPLMVEGVAASYARQIAKKDSGEIERFTRRFNYPKESSIKSKENLPVLGIKTFFCSNVCAAYRWDVYEKLGGFVQRAIFNEDMIYAAALIEAGYKICYAADALVYHSHHYSGIAQFRRNFDLGVSQAENREIFDQYPSEKEGKKLVLMTAKHLLKKKKIYLIPVLFYQSACKYAGYLLGKNYRKLPKRAVLACTGSPWYFSLQ